MDDQEARDGIARVEALLEQIEGLADPAGRDKATELAQALLELYGEGLRRVVDHVADADTDGLEETLVTDELVSHLLMVHDLHPVDLETRVRGALDGVRPYLESHGGDVELLSLDEGVVRLRLQGSCDGCPSSAMTLKLAIEDAVRKAAPDVEEIEAEGATAETAAPESGSGLLQITVSDSLASNGSTRPGGADGGAWATVGGLPELAGGGTIVKTVAGEPTLFLRLDSTFYAYRVGCAGCSASLEEAALQDAELTCAGCGRRYDVRRAGRCLDEPQLFLDPLPLLVTDAGLIKVALAPAVA